MGGGGEMLAQQRDVSQATPTERERDGQVEHDLARVVPGGRLAPGVNATDKATSRRK